MPKCLLLYFLNLSVHCNIQRAGEPLENLCVIFNNKSSYIRIRIATFPELNNIILFTGYKNGYHSTPTALEETQTSTLHILEKSVHLFIKYKELMD